MLKVSGITLEGQNGRLALLYQLINYLVFQFILIFKTTNSNTSNQKWQQDVLPEEPPRDQLVDPPDVSLVEEELHVVLLFVDVEHVKFLSVEAKLKFSGTYSSNIF